MKTKGLLFTLFILYWVAVFGVALFSSELRQEFRKTSLSNFVPFGYSMFTPMTKTNFDVKYEFFKNGKSIEIVSLDNYLENQFDKGLIYNKSSSVKANIYFVQIYQLDLAFQKNHYAKSNHTSTESFDDVINMDGNLKAIAENIQNFSKLYMKENSISADSVLISVERKPMILPFNPNYKGDYTYHVAETVFYRKKLILNKADD